MKSVNPYLNFPGTAEEAFEFYRSVFGGELLQVVRYGDFEDNVMGVAEADLQKVAHIALPLGSDTVLMATDVVDSMPGSLNTGNNFYVMIDADSADEARSIFDGLSDGGTVEMPLQAVEWAELYGMTKDRFDIQWMVSYEGSARFDVGMNP